MLGLRDPSYWPASDVLNIDLEIDAITFDRMGAKVDFVSLADSVNRTGQSTLSEVSTIFREKL